MADDTFDEYIGDFSGGHNDGVPATHLVQNESALLENWIVVDGPVAETRDGVLRETAYEYAEALTGAFVYEDADADRHMILSSLTGFAKQSGDGVVALALGFAALTSDEMPPHFVQYIDNWYAVRRNAGSLMRGNADAVYAAGIAAPTVAATLAAVAGGGMAAGDYVVRFRFINRGTDQPGDLSPPATVTLAANERISITNLQVSTNPFVDDRELFITAVNTDGVFSSVGFVGNNALTTHTLDVTADDFGRIVGLSENGVPPGNLTLLAQAWERLFVSDGDYVYNSGEGKVESFDPADIIPVFTDEQHKILGLKYWSKLDRLVIMKSDSMHLLGRASNVVFYLDMLDEKQGGTAPHSLAAAGGYLFWYDGGSGRFWASNGGEAAEMYNPKIKSYLDAVPAGASRSLVYATIDPVRKWYVVSLPQTGGSRVVLAFDWRKSAWFVFTHAAPYPRRVVALPDEDSTIVLYSLHADGYLYRYLSPDAGGRDIGVRYTCKLRTRALTGKRVGTLLAPRFVRLHCNKVAHRADAVVLKVYKDGAAVAGASSNRSISLYFDEDVKAYTVGNIHKPGTTLQVQLEYSDEDKLYLRGLAVEGVLLDRVAKVR